MRARRSNGRASSSILPASILEKSRMSLMMVSRDSPLVWMVSRYPRWSGVSEVSISRPTMAMTPFIGVRISWLMAARKSALARSLDSARRRVSINSLVAADQIILLPPHLQRGQQARAQEGGFRPFVEAVQRAEFKRAQPGRRVVRAGEGDEQRDAGRRMILKPAKQFRAGTAIPNPPAPDPSDAFETIAAPLRRRARRPARRHPPPERTTVSPPIGDRPPPPKCARLAGSWQRTPVHFFRFHQARTLNTLCFNPPMRFSKKKIFRCGWGKWIKPRGGTPRVRFQFEPEVVPAKVALNQRHGLQL